MIEGMPVAVNLLPVHPRKLAADPAAKVAPGRCSCGAGTGQVWDYIRRQPACGLMATTFFSTTNPSHVGRADSVRLRCRGTRTFEMRAKCTLLKLRGRGSVAATAVSYSDLFPTVGERGVRRGSATASLSPLSFR